MMQSTRYLCVCAFLLGATRAAVGEARPPAASQPKDVTELSLQDLMQIEVVTASRTKQNLSAVPAAVFVITSEEIRRSGATSIPELLRIVPGLQVARIDANKWAISARGFNGRFANKLLVLMDGRSVYTPLYSGVFWEVQDTLLEDVERIEVIRGPGASLWGANAVNGIINIITRDAYETSGGRAVLSAGDEERGNVGARFGHSVDSGAFRIYGKHFRRDAAIDRERLASSDSWSVSRGGFRADLATGERDSMTFQGDIYSGRTGQMLTTLSPELPTTVLLSDQSTLAGGNLLGRWGRQFQQGSSVDLQIYYDLTHRREALFEEKRSTVDVDFQQSVESGPRHDLIWGASHRVTWDELDETEFTRVDPNRRVDNLFGAFVQDQISFLDERLKLTLGSKFEHNDYSGFEIQPNIRAIWRFDGSHSLWGSLSRAVRTPSRTEHDAVARAVVPSRRLKLESPLPTVLLGIGDPHLGPEEVIAVEVGLRSTLARWFTLDVAGFRNRYRDLRSGVLGRPFVETESGPPHLVVPVHVGNDTGARSKGLELAMNVEPSSATRIGLNYSFLDIELLDVDELNPEASAIRSLEHRSNPRHQVTLRLSQDLAALELDVTGRFVDAIPFGEVPSYTTIDFRVARRLGANVELGFVGQNLLEPGHLEFVSEFGATVPTLVERAFYLRLGFQF